MNFEKLVKECSPKLKAIAHRLDGKYTAFNDQDLYQEALRYLWQKFRHGELTGKTRSYILQGCYFEMKNFIRTNHKSLDRVSFSLNEIVNNQGVTWEETIPGPGLDTRCEERELCQGIESLLSENEKKVLRFCLMGMTTREIGGRMGISHVMVVKTEKKIRDRCRNVFFKERKKIC